MKKIVVTFEDGTSKRYVNEEAAEKAIEKAGSGKMEILETNEIKVEFGKKPQSWTVSTDEGGTRIRFEAESTEEARLLFKKYVDLGFEPQGGAAEKTLTATKEELIAMADAIAPKRYDQIAYNRRWTEKNKEHSRYLKDRASCRSFIRNKASIEDLAELEALIQERRVKLQEEQ